MGTLECDKQTAPGFCAECVEYNFWWCPERYVLYAEQLFSACPWLNSLICMFVFLFCYESRGSRGQLWMTFMVSNCSFLLSH